MSSRLSTTTATRTRRKDNEKEAGHDSFKSMGLKAGVLAIMAGLAFYPKTASEAVVVERQRKYKEEKNNALRIRNRRDREEVDDDRRPRESVRRRGVERSAGTVDAGGSRRMGERGGGSRLMRVDEYDMRRGEGFSHRDAKRGWELRMMRRESVEDQRKRDERERAQRWEETSRRSASGSDRTKEWVTGGYEYLSGNQYQERDRKRW